MQMTKDHPDYDPSYSWHHPRNIWINSGYTMEEYAEIDAQEKAEEAAQKAKLSWWEELFD